MAYRDFVAHVHGGQVLLDDSGSLPSITGEDPNETPLRDRLELVGADFPIGPMDRLGEDVFVTTVEVCDGTVPDGRWTDLDTLSDPPGLEGVAEAVRRCVEEYAGTAPPHRPDWYRPGWFPDVEAWIEEALGRVGRSRTGPLVAVQLWSLSAVLRVPTDRGVAWFKATCEHFHGEPAIHRVLADHFPDFVPVLIAEDDDRAWLLMEPLRGATDQAEGAASALATAYPRVQLASLEVLDELRAAGCSDRGLQANLEGWRQVLADSVELPLLTAEEVAAVRAVGEEVEALVEEFWACGLPDTLCHGDLHIGNVAYDGSELRVFDWSDSCLSHPFLDGGHLLHFGAAAGSGPTAEVDTQVADRFAEPWRSAFPQADVDRALALAPLADRVFQAVSYEGIYRATEERSLWELRGITAKLLRRLPESLPEFR